MDPVAPVATPAAPAQPVASPAPTATTPDTQSAAHAAVATGNVRDFRAARRAERAGKPLADVPVAPAAADPAAPAPPVVAASASPAAPAQPSRREREQAETNERIRRAIDAGVQAELDRRGLTAAPRTDPAAPAPPKEEPLHTRLAKLPDAPKLADFESIEEHAAAMSLFVQDKLAEQRSSQQGHEELAAAHRERVQAFFTRLEAAKTADPDFVNKLTPEVKALKPISGLARDPQGRITEPSGPLNVLWELVYDSPHLDKLLLHFSAKPDALRAFEQMPESIQKLPPRLRTSAHIRRIVQQFGALDASFETPSAPVAPPVQPVQPKTLSSAPTPPATLGSRPAEAADPVAAAVRSGDTRAYRRLRREQRAAGIGR